MRNPERNQNQVNRTKLTQIIKINMETNVYQNRNEDIVE